MLIREEIEIAAPLPIVWGVFSALEEWDDWNTACQSCHFIEGEHMATGERLGIHAVHTWTFREINGTVTFISHEEFSGPLIWLARLILVPRRLHSLTRQLLASVKQEAEARYQAQKTS